MKHFIFILIICSIIPFKSTFTQNITKALISKSKLYIGVVSKYSYIKMYKLDNATPPYITLVGSSIYSKYYDYNYCWGVNDTIAYFIDSQMTNLNYWRFTFDEWILDNLDSIERRQKNIEFYNKYPSYDKQLRYYESIEDKTQRNVPNFVAPVSEIFNKHKEAQLDRNKLHGVVRFKFLRESLEMRDITFDFFWQKDNEFMIFVRDDAMITQWHYNYPGKTVRNKPNDWKEIRTYTWQPKGSYEKQDTTPYLPSGKKHIYNAFPDTLANFKLTDSSFAKLSHLPDTTLTKLQKLKEIPFTSDSTYRQMLTDSVGTEEVKQYYSHIKQAGTNLFFKGHFNAIRQGNEIFIVNLQYGGIYWLGAKEVVRVGQFDTENYPAKLFGKQTFIDDRDNERLIFFAPVERLNPDKPYPEIFIPTDEEFREMFKYVIN